jgi:4-hydroxybenzoate polyprenyltransferase
MNHSMVFKSMRPRQWIKNFMVFPALVFSRQLTDPTSLISVAGGFAVFCILSGVVYIYNDINDYENDKNHPTKCFRPIASGQLSTADARISIVSLTLIALLGALALNFVSLRVGVDFLIVCLLYLALQVSYTLFLKNVVILDVGAIAGGFVLRVLAGAAILNVEVSSWIIICTTLLALFLGFGKRRHELVLLSDSAGSHRKILDEYSPYYLDQMISVVTAGTVVAYSLYTMDEKVIENLGTENLPLTIPFVLYGIFRYLYLVHQKEEGGSPSRVLLTDRPLLVNIGLFFVTVVILLYLS